MEDLAQTQIPDTFAFAEPSRCLFSVDENTLGKAFLALTDPNATSFDGKIALQLHTVREILAAGTIAYSRRCRRHRGATGIRKLCLQGLYSIGNKFCSRPFRSRAASFVLRIGAAALSVIKIPRAPTPTV